MKDAPYATPRGPEVRIQGICRTFRRDSREIPALTGVELTLSPGSFTALLGPSGCGKTTLLRVIAGLESPDSGGVLAIPAIPPAVVFQDPRLLPWHTLHQNLELALLRLPEPISRQEKHLRIRQALDIVGLSDRGDAWPRELSGGMAQRAGLARGLCRESRYLLMDEPFSALDALTREKLQADLKGLHRRSRPTILFITHDIHEARELATRIVVMKDGRIRGDMVPRQGCAEEDKALIRQMMA